MCQARWREKRLKDLVENPQGKMLRDSYIYRWEDNTEMDLKGIEPKDIRKEREGFWLDRVY